MRQKEGHKWQQDELIEEPYGKRPGEFYDQGEVATLQAKSQGKHDECENERKKKINNHCQGALDPFSPLAPAQGSGTERRGKVRQVEPELTWMDT